MKQTATLTSLSGSLGTSVKIILTLLFLNLFVLNTSAQININGSSTDWGAAGHVLDEYESAIDDGFTQGSKDFHFAADWRWVFGQVKGKNDIANGAALIVGAIQFNGVVQPGGPFLAFAGDRLKNEGDAQIGFWFFQNGTAPTTQLNGTQNFAPPKTVGDLLVLADFTGGGRDAAITVLRWVGTGGTFPNSDGAFNQVTTGAGVAQNNASTTPVPATWSFPTADYEQNEFYEGFVDLAQFGPGAACFSRFMLETRSSQSITASLDDFLGGPLGGVPDCSITGNNTICAGTSATFTAGTATSYLWSGPGSFTGQGTNVISNLTMAGTYNLTVTNSTGCTSVCSRFLTVNQPTNCTITGNNTVCAGQSASFTATAGGGSYVWSGPGTFTGQGTNVISNLTANGTYNLTITTNNCVSTCSRVLTVNQPTNCEITGNNTVCAGQSATFTATAGGGSYVWSGPGTFTGQGTNVISNLTANGTYNLTITTNNCVSTCSRVLTVNQPTNCQITGTNTICAGASTSFTATAGGGSYVWSGPGTFTGQGTNVISNLTANGTYNLTITTNNCVSTCSRVLTVNQPTNCEITGTNTICAGTSATFTATAGGGTYVWSGPGTFTGQGTNVISNLTANGTYNLTITTNNCVSTCSRVLTVNQQTNCTITGNNTVCAGQSATFTATAGGGSYVWSGPGTFTGQGTNVISNLTANGTYNLTITTNNCVSTCSRVLTVNKPINCQITGTNTICAGQSAIFTATAGGGSYVWSGPGTFTGQGTNVISNLTAAGTYNLTITSGVCITTCNRTLAFVPNASANAGAPPAAQCRNVTVVAGSLVYLTNTFALNGSVQNGTPSWSVAPGGNLAGYTVGFSAPGSLSTNVNISGDVNGGTVTLRLTATSNTTPPCGNAFSDVTVTLNARPLIKTVVGSDFCPNVTTTGSVTLFNSENLVSYQLKIDGGASVQAPKIGDGGPLTWTDLAPASYIVEGTFPATTCNSTSGPASVVENNADEPEITSFSARCNTDGPVDLNTLILAIFLGGEWSGTGVTGNTFNPGGLAPGTYTISYAFTNLFGCRVTATTQATIVSCASQLCTYTQGAYGSEGGLSCDGENDGLTTTELINQSLGNWPGGSIRIGVSQLLPTNIQNYVQINDADAACIIATMPGGGPAKEVTGANQICSLPNSMLKNGRIHNVLLAQTIALGLNIGINPPDLGNFTLQAGTLYTAEPVGGCGSNVPKLRRCTYDTEGLLILPVENEYLSRSFSQALIDAIEDAGYPKTVSGLFGLANDAIGNKDGVVGTEQGVSLSEIAGGAGSINEVFDECRISVGWDIGPCAPSNIVAPPRITVSGNAEAATIGKLKVSTYPNPYRNNVRFVIESPVSGQAILDVYNIAGQKVQTLFNGHIDANETRIIDFKPAVANGMLIYTLRIGNQQVTGKLIGLKQ